MIKNNGRHILVKLAVLFALFLSLQATAQITPSDSSKISYLNSKEYIIGGIAVAGAHFYNKQIIITLTQLHVGDKVDVPGEKLSDAIAMLWKQDMFSAIDLSTDSIVANKVYLKFTVVGLQGQFAAPVLKGITKADKRKLDEKLKPYRYNNVSPQLENTLGNIIKEYFINKGHYNIELNITKEPSATDSNRVRLVLNISPGPKTKINKVNIVGNNAIADRRLHRQMKETKERRWTNIFTASKFTTDGFTKDKHRIIELYNERGYRDAAISKDTVYHYNPKLLNVDLAIEEGHVYYIGNITWVGNTKYTTDTLNKVLGIKRGDIYDKTALDHALFMNATGTDIASLYLDNGYLFYNLVPVETGITNDSVDFEMRIYEGKPARINKIIIKGNVRTNDHVILREIFTQPGQLFRRTDVIMSQQALLRLGYFVPQQLQVNPIPDAATNTVDIEYVVVEKPSDQIYFSGGIGAGKLVGSLNLMFTNFSFRNTFNKKAWTPLPSGDGQTLALNIQSNGRQFQSYNLSVTEPWLGGKKPNSLTNSVYYNSVNTGGQLFNALGYSLGLGTRWRKPDNYFNSYYSINLLKYNAQNYPGLPNGNAYNVNLGVTIARNSVEAGDYPMGGSNISFALQATPPWSLNKDLTNSPDRYKKVAYHKWKFDVSWFQKIAGKLTLNATAHFGYVGYYNKTIGAPKFDLFDMGGIQISNTSFVGREYINLRGYQNGSLSPSTGSPVYNRFVMELRHPIYMKKDAGLTTYALAFIEAGNTWNRLQDYNPAAQKRSAGFGIRAILPMFGLIGVDAAYGFDTKTIPNYSGGPWQIHFVIGKYFN